MVSIFIRYFPIMRCKSALFLGIKCCVQQHNQEICGECYEFPCQKFNTKWFGEDAYDSFVTHKMALANMQFIQKHGIDLFLKQQKKRIHILETLLQNYNDGRSKNYYCLTTALLSPPGLEKGIKTLKETLQKQGIKKDDLKNRAKIAKDIFNKIAEEEKIQLKLNKPPTWKK